MYENPLVSVICITYNHKKYIEQCIESLVNQKTDFQFEVIVHDDASVDGTDEIISELQNRYPDIVKSILQKENQYSMGKCATDIAVNAARGKYLAFCEGDDWWCNEYKLQEQADYMQTHKDCVLCFHNTYTYYVSTDTMDKEWFFWRNRQLKEDGFYNSHELMELGVVPYSAQFFKKENYVYRSEFKNNNKKYGDMLRTLCLASKGYAYCINRHMSVYRRGVENSFFTNTYKNIEQYNNSVDTTINTYMAVMEYTRGKFNEFFAEKIAKAESEKIHFCKEEVLSLKKSAKKIYIYGTGVYAQLCYHEMKSIDMEIDGFVVSDTENNKEDYLGHRVYKLSEVKDSDMAIVISVGSKARKIIENNLADKQIRKYCYGCVENN